MAAPPLASDTATSSTAQMRAGGPAACGPSSGLFGVGSPGPLPGPARGLVRE